ncbi:heavy metal-associated isoprenylated plant protein 6-like [Panicum hallii]|uniref:heavy metal-associated isoprenylated plant protein 6-like n=1 Tax=Panicum hallii TaxID=206008 RepID=UPI000DF4D1A0|nr:heavy metal-associated isoprenylated plant protein 6-like [Panicum hallii]
MAPVILAMDVHCDSCAKKIRKAIMKVPGAESVTASYETGLVVVEGTADAAAVMARLRAKTKKAARVVSDAGPADPPAPAPPIFLEMDLHCRSCAEKVEQRVMEIPDCSPFSSAWNLTPHVLCARVRRPCVRTGVDAVTTDVPGRRVEVTGTVDASAVATSLEVTTRRPVRVVSDPRSAGDVPEGYDHEQRKAAAARAAAEQITQEMYGATAHAEPQEATAADDASNHSTVPPSAARPAGGRRRGRRASQRAPSPPVQQPPSSGMPPSPPASSSYGAPPPEAGCYHYPAQPEGVYGDQHWAAPAPPSGDFYMPQGGECYGQQWPKYAPPAGAFYPHQGGECFGQQWPAYPPPEPEPEGYYPYGRQPEGYYPYGGQPDENPGGCSIQ